jgi:hypothetical protein
MRPIKPILILVLVTSLVCVFFSQRSLNAQRESAGLTRTTVISNAPPVLAFTTVALGGFRGIIANILWIRAAELQENGKYFEMVQLADWITKLQPHFSQVWVNQAWNMAYNISVKFPNPEDRWHWVLRGIELLRDQGMVYNPNEILMYRELGWFFQHKMGAYLDDAHMTYKREWATLMEELFGAQRPNFEALINPKTPEERHRSDQLSARFKMDPRLMKEVDEMYGPLEWRLPEAHAMYWANAGIKFAKWNGKPEEQFIMLWREIYQPMLTAFQRGRFITNKADKTIQLGPNLAMVPNVSRAYERAMTNTPEMKEHIGNAHKNFLRDASYFLFANNREKEAQKWFELGSRLYGTNFAGGMDLVTFSMGQISENINETSPDKVKALLEGLIMQWAYNLAIDEDDRAVGLERMAQLVRANFITRIGSNKSSKERLSMPTIAEIKQDVLGRMLKAEDGLHPELQDILRSKLGLPAAAPAPAAAANPDTKPAAPATKAPSPP